MNEKTPERKVLEQVMKSSTVARTAPKFIEMALKVLGISTTTRQRLQNVFRNINDQKSFIERANTGRPALYRYKQQTTPTKTDIEVQQPKYLYGSDFEINRPPARPDALDHQACPSRVDDKLIPYRPPMSLGGLGRVSHGTYSPTRLQK